MPEFNRAEKQKIASSVLDKYEKVAESPRGQFKYPTGREGLEKLGYDMDLTGKLPDAVLEFYVGVGNPFAPGRPSPGMKVLDIGSGAGVDTLLAAIMAAPDGAAAGIERSRPMTARARQNRRLSRVGNAGFVEGSAEALPFPAEYFDIVISNGVYNLVVEKQKALNEAFRVLKKGGRIQIADQILTGLPETDHKARLESWFT